MKDHNSMVKQMLCIWKGPGSLSAFTPKGYLQVCSGEGRGENIIEHLAFRWQCIFEHGFQKICPSSPCLSLLIWMVWSNVLCTEWQPTVSKPNKDCGQDRFIGQALTFYLCHNQNKQKKMLLSYLNGCVKWTDCMCSMWARLIGTKGGKNPWIPWHNTCSTVVKYISI